MSNTEQEITTVCVMFSPFEELSHRLHFRADSDCVPAAAGSQNQRPNPTDRETLFKSQKLLDN